jgi:hypothetical protein
MMRFVHLLGTPSITLLALALDLLARRRLYSRRERSALLAFAAAASVILYSSTLGYLPVDVYRAGFSVWAPIALAVGAMAVAWRSPAIACTALVALVAYDIPVFRSVNLFDYVVDPILGIVAIVWGVGAAGTAAIRPPGRRRYTEPRTAASFSAKRAGS